MVNVDSVNSSTRGHCCTLNSKYQAKVGFVHIFKIGQRHYSMLRDENVYNYKR